MNPLLIGIGIIILLIIGIRLLRYISDGFWRSASSGCTRLLMVIGGVLAIIFIINLISPILTPANTSIPVATPTIDDPSVSQESATNLLIPIVCCLIIIGIGIAIGIYFFVQKSDTTHPPISTLNIDTKRKNDAPLVGDDGEFVTSFEPSKNKSPDSPPLSFTGRGSSKSVTREFDLEKGMYRVDFKVPLENELSVEIVDVSTGYSDDLLDDEEHSGSTLYNNKKTGRFVLKIKLDTKPRDSWSVSLTPLK